MQTTAGVIAASVNLSEGLNLSAGQGYNRAMKIAHFKTVLFDWGDTLMRDDPDQNTPMVTWPHVEAVPGSGALLEYLHSAGFQLVLATSASISNETEIRAALGRVGLDRYLPTIYCFSNTRLPKTSPVFYPYILEDLRADPSETLMVGDNFEFDVLAANRAGISAVWYNPSTAEERSAVTYLTVHSLAGLLSLFQEAAANRE